MMDSAETRIEEFRQSLFSAIPHRQDADQELAAMPVPVLLRTYMNWSHRLIRPERRIVRFAPNFWSSPYVTDKTRIEIARLSLAIESGDSLQPYLSKLPVKLPGYFADKGHQKAMAWNRAKIGKENVFEKDSCLNAYDLHHLHLGELRQGEDFCDRTSIVLFAYFTRSYSDFVYLGPHDFHSTELGQAVAEWRVARGLALKGIRAPQNSSIVFSEEELKQIESAGLSAVRIVDDLLVPTAMQAMSGDGLRVISHTQQCLRAILDINAQLDEAIAVRALFAAAPLPIGEMYRLRWCVRWTDFGLQEENTNQFCCVVQGMT